MKNISFYVQGDPKGQPRPRAFAFHGKARVYDPGTAEGWKSLIAIEAKKAGLPKFEGPVSVRLRFFFKRPKAHFNKRGMKPSAPVWYTQRSDIDNLQKSVLDALTQLDAWKDDSFVVEIEASKSWSSGDSPGGCSICIMELE